MHFFSELEFLLLTPCMRSRSPTILSLFIFGTSHFTTLLSYIILPITYRVKSALLISFYSSFSSTDSTKYNNLATKYLFHPFAIPGLNLCYERLILLLPTVHPLSPFSYFSHRTDDQHLFTHLPFYLIHPSHACAIVNPSISFLTQCKSEFF